jgi:hypothetical protein
MKHYSQELKDSLVARMLAPHNESVGLSGNFRGLQPID